MQSEIIEICQKDDTTMNKYICVMDFMNKELQYYNRYISSSNTNIQSYVEDIKQEANKLFPELNEGNSRSSPNQNQRISKESSAPPKMIKEEPKQPLDRNAVSKVSTYFNRLEQRSKSPINGFQKINQSLSRQKATTIKRSISPIASKNKITKSMVSLKQSKISPIFSNPPNQYPPPKNYEGREIGQNIIMRETLKSITKSQGLRRFKTANFKGKSSLFENEHLQLGFKSEAIYDEVNGFKVIIKIELYFGNLTDQRITDLSLEFKGDQNLLLYASPRIIESTIARGEQNKIDLIIVPIKVPFPLLGMTIRYTLQEQTRQNRVIVPNSVIKLAHFMSIRKQQFQKRWISTDVLKSSQFPLCHYLPPDSFTKWIPQLGELSNYTTFVNPGSKKDYELYCVVIMMQRYESLLKINVRPNLNVVVQLGIEDKNEQSMQYFIYLLESLQQLLQRVA